jgi:N-acetylmuramoyl-L-alanine amidase
MVKISSDAGHGGFGITPGKRCPDGSMYEWDFNSTVVKYMIAELANYENVQTLRVDDPSGKTDVPLKTRTDKVNAWGSNVHISVHANAAGNGWSDAHGIETFVYKATLEESVSLARLVQNELIKVTGLSNRGVKEADLHMVRETRMTSILCECGFMTNHEEATLLKSDSYRKKVALAIVAGLTASYGLKKKVVPKSISIDGGYIIKSGENFWKLEEKLKLKHGTLQKLNPNVDPNKLKVGQKIQVK